MEKPLCPDSPVTALRGISTVRAGQLAKLGVHSLYDLVTLFPRTYEDRTKTVQIGELEPNVPACFAAAVISTPQTSRIRKGLDVTKVQVADDTGKLRLVFFNQPYLKDSLRYGESYVFYGAIHADFPSQMQNPAFEPISRAGTVTGRLFPVYPLTAGLSNTVVSRAVRQAVDVCLPQIPELLPPSVREKYGLCSASFAYQTVHAPQNMQALEQAQRRLVFEEFFVLSAALRLMRASRSERKAAVYDCCGLEKFLSALPFAPTNAQRRVMQSICADLSSGVPMNRLVQGDVGSGKTAVAAAAAFLAVQNGKQAAFLAPTQILAEQHYASLSPMLEQLGVRTVLLTGGANTAAKKAVKSQIASGEAQLIIGTHALLSADVTFFELDLVIADEQHRFGVAQRAALAAKGKTPHLLVMSATPIPRTLALIVYGELDVSVIDELPPGRQKIDTYLVGEDMRKRINAFIRKQCEQGGQVYIVCPAVEESETETLRSAETWAQTLQTAVFPDLRVGLLHGQMKAAQKESVMAAFAAHELDILVSTTVIEVGVDVPNANLMVVENADRFGLSQLHQLRGRVGRGERKSYCVLFSSAHGEETKQRLKTLCESSDGFAIAQKDLLLRGPGDFLGSRQHGLPLLKVASLQTDLQTLEQAQQAAETSLCDPQWLSSPEYAALQERMEILFRQEPVALN